MQLCLDVGLLCCQVRVLVSTSPLRSSLILIHFWLTKQIHSFCMTNCYSWMNVLIHSWRLVSIAMKLSKDFPKVITFESYKTFCCLGKKNTVHNCRIRPHSPHGHKAKHFILTEDHYSQSIWKSFRLNHYSLQIV